MIFFPELVLDSSRMFVSDTFLFSANFMEQNQAKGCVTFFASALTRWRQAILSDRANVFPQFERYLGYSPWLAALREAISVKKMKLL